MGEGWALLSPDGLRVDVIVPIPLHRARKRERGYNQSDLLACELAAYLERPVLGDVLVRRRATAPQVGLSAAEREENVQGAFECVGGEAAGKRVLLVDDVYTTGSTLAAASAALRDGGARSVWAYTLARAG
jgi:ComF family protein